MYNIALFRYYVPKWIYSYYFDTKLQFVYISSKTEFYQAIQPSFQKINGFSRVFSAKKSGLLTEIFFAIFFIKITIKAKKFVIFLSVNNSNTT